MQTQKLQRPIASARAFVSPIFGRSFLASLAHRGAVAAEQHCPDCAQSDHAAEPAAQATAATSR